MDDIVHYWGVVLVAFCYKRYCKIKLTESLINMTNDNFTADLHAFCSAIEQGKKAKKDLYDKVEQTNPINLGGFNVIAQN